VNHGIAQFLASVAAAMFAAPAMCADEHIELSRRERGDLAIHARAILKQYCHECHGGSKSRGAVQILDYKELIATNPIPFVAPKNVPGSQIIQFLEDGSMPPGGRPRPSQADVDVLKKWIANSAPSFPVSFDDAGTIQTILDDLKSRGADGPFLRYFSFAHLISDKGPLPDLKKAEFDLKRALTMIGVGIDDFPQPVDDTATLFRFDIRKMGWENRQLFYRFDNRVAGDINSLSAYDVLLLDYPFGTTLVDKRFDDYFANAKLVRPIPYLRADWLSRSLLSGVNPLPLADDLKSLTELSAALKQENFPGLGQEGKMPCGPKVRPFGAAAKKPEPNFPILPLSAWHSGDVQPDPPPFELSAELIDETGKALTTVTKDKPFQLRVNSKQKLRFVLLLVTADGTVRLQQTNKNGLLDKEESILTPGPGTPFKIADIVTGGKKATEYFVLLASETLLPPITIVRSRHGTSMECEKAGQFPMYRFLFDRTKTPEGFDPARVVRKVIPIPVTVGTTD